MLPKISTQSGYPPITNRPRGWQSYLSSLVALIVLLGGLGASQNAWGQMYNYSDVFINSILNNTSASISTVYNGKYSVNDQIATADFEKADLGNGGMFDQNTGSLIITQATDNLTTGSSNPFKSSLFLYRVYLYGAATIPNYTQINLTQTSANNYGPEVTFSSGTVNIDLLNQAAVLGGGTYIVEIRFSSAYSAATRTNPNGTGIVEDPSTSAGYKATFVVKAPATTPTGGTTTWQSTASTDWAVASNWSNGVPNSTSNAIIPAQTAPAASIVYPILNDPNYDYSVNNLTLQGNTSSTSSALTVNAATLTIYGNLSQGSGGLTGNTIGTNSSGRTDAKNNSTIVFAGGDQVITGNLVVSDIIIAGSGTKSVINQLNPSNILAFKPTSVSAGVIVQSASQDLSNGTIQTSFSTTGTSYIQLGASAIISLANGEAETTSSYVKGVLRADRTLTAGIFNSFGNIGLDVTPNHNPGSIYIYRIVGDALSSPQNNSPAKPIKRQYQIVGDDDSNSSGTSGSTVNVVFHYLPSTDELNGINEGNLTMFRTINKGRTYDATGGDLNASFHTVSLNNLPTLTNYTLTLGDKTNPLPVSLVAFGATHSGANTLLSWTTASEERNTGFNVQVSTDGANFRTLSFVASQSPNSSTTLNYKYTDTEVGKTGTRYYRLEQVDEGGEKNYSPVRIVNFSGAATGTGVLVAYPNPFNEGLSLSLDGSSIADGTASVKIVDMTGRTVRESKLPLVGASLTLSDMSALRSGLYLAKVTLPDGSTQTVRISKQ